MNNTNTTLANDDQDLEDMRLFFEVLTPVLPKVEALREVLEAMVYNPKEIVDKGISIKFGSSLEGFPTIFLGLADSKVMNIRLSSPSLNDLQVCTGTLDEDGYSKNNKFYMADIYDLHELLEAFSGMKFQKPLLKKNTVSFLKDIGCFNDDLADLIPNYFADYQGGYMDEDGFFHYE